MSAIAGMVAFDPAGEPSIAAMREALGFVVAEREADWHDRHCALYAKRLVIESTDRTAPLPGPDERGVVVALEGYVYNRPELAAELGLDATAGAERLIVAAWRRWGDTFVRQLNGEFALAAWDGGARRLLLAGDHVGTVPLYWMRAADGRYVFATELEAIIAATKLKPEPDWAKIADLLARAGAEPARTFLHGVHTIPPGASLVVSAGGESLNSYWNYADLHAAPIRDRDESFAAFRTALERAVRRRLPDLGPVGAHLTGGLDSSSVAAVAARHLRPTGRTLHLYSIVAELPGQGQGGGDIDYIPSFLRDYPECAHDYVRGGGRESYSLPGLPNGPINLQLTSAIEDVTRLAQKAGCRVMLTGWGGEAGATYTGYGVYQSALRAGQWRWLWSEMQAETRTWRERLRWVRALLQGNRRSILDRGGPYYWAILRDCLTPEFIAAERIRERCLSVPPRPGDPLAYGQSRYLAGVLRQGRLGHWALQGRAEGFRYRYPLLDRELLETVRRLPATVHIHRGRRRELVRQALGDILPPEIAARPSKFSPTTSGHLVAEAHKNAERHAKEVWPELQPFVRKWPGKNAFDVGQPDPSSTPGLRLIKYNLIATGGYLKFLSNHYGR